MILLQNSLPACLPAIHPCTRGYSSVHTQQPAGPLREYKVDPYTILDDELKEVFDNIREVSFILF